MENKKKYIIILGDGMADEPIAELGNRTPLEAAHTPYMDRLASAGVLGMARTVPEGISPGSDTANLSIFGYNPRTFYTGRAPLEALNMGIALGDNDAAFRCNIVDTQDGIMNDFTAHHIDTRLSEIVVSELNRAFGTPQIEFFTGVSYRHIMVWRDFPFERMPDTTPPHDISGRSIDGYYPKGEGADVLDAIMRKAPAVIAGSALIKDGCALYNGHPVAVWLWGGGRRPQIEPLTEKYALKGCTISAVDLIHGIGRAAGLSPHPVEGATGYIDTNYEGKAAAALDVLSGESNFVFLHVESPDESGHEGNIAHKIMAIEDFDARVVGPVLEGLKKFDDYTVLLMPDHPTPIRTKTHTAEPVPFVIFRNTGFPLPEGAATGTCFSEKEAARTGVFLDDASVLMESLIRGYL